MLIQGGLIECKMLLLDERCMKAGQYMAISVLSAQLFCKFKTVLHIKSINYFENDCLKYVCLNLVTHVKSIECIHILQDK